MAERLTHYYNLKNGCLLSKDDTTVFPNSVTCPVCIARMEDQNDKEEPMEGAKSQGKEFFMILVDGTTSIGYHHNTYDQAVKDAERLLNQPQNQGKGATILRAILYGKLASAPIEWHDLTRKFG